MLNGSAELLAELSVFLLYAIITSVVTGLGLAAEYNSLQNAIAGEYLVALWFAWMGTIALYFGVNLTRDKLAGQTRKLRQAL